MTDTGVDIHLEIARNPQAVAVSAFVSSPFARTLTWRLVAESRTAGGTSRVVQSGVTDGKGAGALGTLAVLADSQGCVVFTVLENEREIARTARSIHLDAADEGCLTN